ncbi:MFS transporter [Oleomonas cavernae]|uniref:MFS transporter n=1 Tax=Oleomonas cavernae TaxID=2320859 RepID=A0A418WCD5_9PROT|nr:MFS transporter [Oleomonas cavernae]
MALRSARPGPDLGRHSPSSVPRAFLYRRAGHPPRGGGRHPVCGAPGRCAVRSHLRDDLRPLPHPLGRRRPWLFVGTILLIVAIWHTFLPPETITWRYFLFWMIVLYASWTMVIVPYAAWGAELTGDFDERTRVAGIRELFLLIGTVLAASVPTVLKSMGYEGQGATLAAIAVFVIVGLPIAIGLLFWKVPEPAVIASPHVHSWRAGFDAIRKNGPFARLISAFLLNATAQAMVATLFFFYVKYVLGAGTSGPYLLLTYFISGIVAVPVWMRLAERFGKHRTWAFSMISSALIFLITPFLGVGDVWIFGVISVLTGFSLGCDQILAASMQADVVDIDSIRSGQQRAGLYFALWNMVTKLAGGIAAGITLPLLGYYGFIADGRTNPASALAALTVLFAVVPPILRLLSVWIIWNYPITRERHAKLRALMERKLARRAAAAEAAAAKG